MRSPDICPNCGAEVPLRAKACPECGADEKTGWSEDAATSALGLPEEHFDYNEFVKREFNPPKSRVLGIRWYYWLAAVLLVLVLLGLIRFH